MKRILIVEDEPNIAMDIQSTVKKLGFEVVAKTRRFTDTIKAVRKHEPDIILMDINLGAGKSGIEAAEEIKKIKDIAIIYLTSYTDDKTMKQAKDTCPAGFLAKPFQRKSIKKILELVVEY